MFPSSFVMVARQVSSLQHPIVKHLVKLRSDRSYRHSSGTVLIVGKALIKEMTAVKTLILAEGEIIPNTKFAKEVFIAPKTILNKITKLSESDGWAAEVELPQHSDLRGKNYIIVLDGISDPGNLGSLFRTALALGWDGVYVTVDSVDPFNDKALRAAKGATFRMPFCIGSHQEFIEFVQSRMMHTYVADIGGKPYHSKQIVPPIALILGNESHGVSDQFKTKFPSISIPISSNMESLNVAVAGALLMHRLKGFA